MTGLDLKLERTKARVTATRLAEIAGVSRQWVTNIESRDEVTAKATIRYLAALNDLKGAIS